jgi:hypothetical protein
MKIEVLYLRNCPNHVPTMDRLRTVLSQEGLPADITEIEVKDPAAAKELGFVGSPTVRVDGLDIEPDCRTGTVTGFACRRYAGGLPSEELIRAAIREARESQSARADEHVRKRR